MIGCAKVIGVDRVKSRLELAKTLGTTDCLDTSSADLDIVEQVKKLTGGDGATIVIDTTGVPALLEAGLQFTARRGKVIFLGVAPPDFSLSVHVGTHMTVCCFAIFPAARNRKSAYADAPQTGISLMGSIEGDSFPEKV